MSQEPQGGLRLPDGELRAFDARRINHVTRVGLDEAMLDCVSERLAKCGVDVTDDHGGYPAGSAISAPVAQILDVELLDLRCGESC